MNFKEKTLLVSLDKEQGEMSVEKENTALNAYIKLIILGK